MGSPYETQCVSCFYPVTTTPRTTLTETLANGRRHGCACRSGCGRWGGRRPPSGLASHCHARAPRAHTVVQAVPTGKVAPVRLALMDAWRPFRPLSGRRSLRFVIKLRSGEGLMHRNARVQPRARPATPAIRSLVTGRWPREAARRSDSVVPVPRSERVTHSFITSLVHPLPVGKSDEPCQPAVPLTQRGRRQRQK